MPQHRVNLCCRPSHGKGANDAAQRAPRRVWDYRALPDRRGSQWEPRMETFISIFGGILVFTIIAYVLTMRAK
jgi:hypothetical protein